MELKELNIREFEIEKIPLSCSMIVIGAPQSGKGTFIENIMYYNRHRIPTARLFTGSETQYERFCKITHPLYVNNFYDEAGFKASIARQRKLKLDHHPHGNSLTVVDDAGDSPAIFRSRPFLGAFKIGTQHWSTVFILANQYAIDFPPPIRKSPTYIVLFREKNELERKKLYQNFGGICGSYETFCQLFDALTGDYTCMIIWNAGNQNSGLEDSVFYYRTVPLDTDWKFGCREYHQAAEARADPDYKEEVMM